MKQIIHQTQPAWNSCVSTCLAMLAGLPAEEVVDKYHDRYWEGRSVEILSILDDLGIVAVPCTAINRSIYSEQVYLICVPSLNIIDGTHQIIVDYREGDFKVFDPAMGREGKKFYAPPNKDKVDCEVGEYPMETWHIDFRILECPALGVIA